MTRNSFIFTIFFILLISAGSCYTDRLTFSVLQPAEEVLPASLRKISIIPMAGVPSETGFFDSLKVPFDVNAIRIGYLDGIYSVLSASPRFEKVILSDSADFVKNAQVYWDDLEKVCRKDGTQAVLILSKAVTKSVISRKVYQYFDFVLENQTRWIFYEPFKQQALARFNFVDTTIILDYAILENPEIIYDALYITGEACGKRLVPYWKDVNRILYTGPGKDLRDASEFVEANRWRNAGLLWNDLIGHRKTVIVSRAAFNLAVAFERDDDLYQAYAWLRYADSLQHTQLNTLYLDILEKRMENQILIDSLMVGN